METFEHTKPEKNFESEQEYFHSIAIVNRGRHVGDAQFFYKNDPFPYYYLSFVYINKADRGKGLGSRLIDEFNKFLDDHGKAGILVNSIQEPELMNLYKNHGWEEVANHPDWLIYNTPSNIDPNKVSSAVARLVLE